MLQTEVEELYVELTREIDALEAELPNIQARRHIVDVRRLSETLYQTLRENRQVLEIVLENSAATIYAKRKDGRYIYVNHEMEVTHNLTREQVLGRTDFELFPREVAEQYRANDLAAMKTGKLMEAEERVMAPSGERLYLAKKVPLISSSGEVDGMCGISTDITDLHRTELALRESEQRWRSLTEALPQLVWSATPDGACDYFSTQWTEYTGVAESELLGWRWMDVLHPDDRQSTRQIWTDSVAGRRAYDVEYRVRRHDGTYGWFKTRGVPIRDSNGNIVKWFGSCTDITDRKRAEEALRESEQELRKARNELEKKVAERTAELRRSEAYLAEAQRLTRTGSWAVTVANREIVHLSDQFYQIFGFDPERGMPSQQTIRQRIHPEDRPASFEIIDKAIREGKGYELDWRIVLPEGTIKFIHVVARPIFNTSDDLVEFVGTVMDVTERKRGEYLTRQVFESSPDSMAIIGTDYRLQRVNPVFERFWGKTAATVFGMHIAEITGTEFFEQKGKPNLDRCFAGEEVNFADWYATSGGRRYRVTTYSPLRPDMQRVEAALLIARDFTDYMQASEALREAQSELAHVNRVATMGQLTASIAHEVNQPIAAAVTNASAGLRWLAAQPPDLKEIRDAFEGIIKASNQASEVVSRIRGLIKKVPEQKAPLDVNEAILETIALTRSEMQQHGILLKTELANDVPQILGDRVQLQQVILNLIMNAIEAMSETSQGPRELLVRSEIDVPDGVMVTVRDWGPGFKPESLNHLFDPFYTTKPAGMGMGLSICRSIIEAHGGRLWATANTPRGAVFQFTLHQDDAS
jgi:PAS domain S-box-containing protein